MNLRSGSTVGAGILQSQHREQFEEGVKVILKKWTAFQLAIQEEWGGRNSREKGEDAEDELLEWFYRKKEHDVYDLEPLLEAILLEDFNTEAQDGSPEEVDHDGAAVDDDSSGDEEDGNDDAEAMDTEDAPAGAVAHVQEEQAPPKGPIVDDDGFELVQRGRRRR